MKREESWPDPPEEARQMWRELVKVEKASAPGPQPLKPQYLHLSLAPGQEPTLFIREDIYQEALQQAYQHGRAFERCERNAALDRARWRRFAWGVFWGAMVMALFFGFLQVIET